MIPYTKHTVTDADRAAVERVLRSDRLADGPEVGKLEKDLERILGVPHAVAVSSGTAALHLAYLTCGVELNTRVLTTPISFVATTNMLLHCGAQIIFMDTDQTGLVKQVPDVAQTWVPVSLGGRPVFLENMIITAHPVIYDACHALSPQLGIICGMYQAACVSFHPAKQIAGGEGGAILTRDPVLARRCSELRDHGRDAITRKAIALGFNYRMDEMTAALARSQLSRIHSILARRRHITTAYNNAFRKRIEVVHHPGGSTCYLYNILVDDRAQVQKELARHGVGTQKHFEPIIPLQPYYQERFCYRASAWPNAERFASRVLSIPMFPSLTQDEVDQVITAVLRIAQSGS